MSLTEYNRYTGETYYSQSRKMDIPIADETQFNDFHLVATYNKLARDVKEACDSSGVSDDISLLLALAREMGYRDLIPDHKGGKPPGDPRLPLPEPPAQEPGEEAPPWGGE